MLVQNEQRFQKIYFSLSALVACTMLILVYISMRTTIDEHLRDELKLVQRQQIYEKTNHHWHYNNSWRHIGNTTYHHMIYSAYFDARTDVVDKVRLDDYEMTIGSIRIFAVLPIKLRDSFLICIVRYDDFSTEQIRAEEAGPMQDEYNSTFAAWNIKCPLHVMRHHSGGDGNATTGEPKPIKLPQAVALAYASNRLSKISPTYIQISYPRQMDQLFAKSRPTISVCVRPQELNYVSVVRLVEFVEMYRIQGVTHFYFYYHNATEEVLRVLVYYKLMGLADLFVWNMHHNNNDDLNSAGLVVQLNDCVYRANVVDNYRYAAVVNLEEIIMPLKHNSLRDYMRQCDEGRTSGFVFRNVFFYKKDNNDTFNVPEHTRNRLLYTQSKIRRTLEIMPAYTLSKCVVNARAIVEMGNHQVFRSAPGYADHIVHHTVGLLFHYRDKCLNCKMLMIIDYTARRYGSLIFDRVDNTCLEIFIEQRGICTPAEILSIDNRNAG